MTHQIKVGDRVWYAAETVLSHYRGSMLEREDIQHHRVFGTVVQIRPNELWGDIALLSVGSLAYECPTSALHSSG